MEQQSATVQKLLRGCMQIAVMAAGNWWLWHFRVKLLCGEREDKQVPERADSSALHGLFAFITHNKGDMII